MPPRPTERFPTSPTELWEHVFVRRESTILHADEILMQVAPEWTPDRIVMIDAGLALFGGITLEAEAAEFDHHFIGAERSDDVATQGRAAQVRTSKGDRPYLGFCLAPDSSTR